MAKQPKQPEQPEASTFQLDAETQRSLLEVALCIKGSGFVPHTDLRERFGDRIFTIFSAIAYRDYRIVREVRRPWKDNQTAIGHEWADRRFSRQEAKRVPAELQWVVEVCSASAPRYTDFKHIVFGCRWTNRVLAALPVPETDKRRVFERVNGDVLIPAYCSRAMMRKVFPLVGKAEALANHIRFAAVRVPINGSIAPHLVPVVDEWRHQGRGVIEHESLPPGTEFTLEFSYPSSEITEVETVDAVLKAGFLVRFSPARSSGYGDFEVLTVNGQPLVIAEHDVRIDARPSD